MKHIIFIALLYLANNVAVGQKWTVNSGDDAFDGKYKSASISGSGGTYPYNNPSFIVNYFENGNSLNIYIKGAGYAGCDNKAAYFKFDKENQIYWFDISTNSNKDAWFLWTPDDTDSNTLSKDDLLDKLKNHSIVYVRLSSDCGQSDYVFSLTGSASAINYVDVDYKKKNEEIKLKELEWLEADEQVYLKTQAEKPVSLILRKEIEEKNLQIFLTGKVFKTRAKYYGNIYTERNKNAHYENISLIAGEEITISNYILDDKYCILLKAASFEIPSDNVLYIYKSCVDLFFLEDSDVLIDENKD